MASVTFKVAVVDSKLDLKNVPKFGLAVVKKGDAAFAEQRLATGFDGVAAVRLPAGEYVARSVTPLAFEGKTFIWERPSQSDHRT